MRTVFPYPILASAVALKVVSVTVDNRPVSIINAVSDSQRVIALHGISRDWVEVRIGVVVSTDANELSAGPWKSPVCIAMVQNSKTNVREAFPLRRGASGDWHGDIELRHGEHVGRCEISASVIAEVGAVSGRLIGMVDESWSADFEARHPVRQRSVRMLWKDFADNSNDFLEKYREDPWFLDANSEEPVLYLNSAVEGFRSMLENSKTAEQKIVGEVLMSQIASEVWSGMFGAALFASSADGDDAQWPGGWYDDVLKRMLPDLFPDMSPDEALLELVGRRVAGESGPDFQARLLHASTKHAKKQKAVAGAVRELARISNVRGDS
jgi:hypothetical protein